MVISVLKAGRGRKSSRFRPLRAFSWIRQPTRIPVHWVRSRSSTVAGFPRLRDAKYSLSNAMALISGYWPLLDSDRLRPPSHKATDGRSEIAQVTYSTVTD